MKLRGSIRSQLKKLGWTHSTQRLQRISPDFFDGEYSKQKEVVLRNLLCACPCGGAIPETGFEMEDIYDIFCRYKDVLMQNEPDHKEMRAFTFRNSDRGAQIRIQALREAAVGIDAWGTDRGTHRNRGTPMMTSEMAHGSFSSLTRCSSAAALAMRMSSCPVVSCAVRHSRAAGSCVFGNNPIIRI